MNPDLPIQDIIAFIADKAGVEITEIKEDTDIFEELGLWGDDSHELIAEYAEKYQVNLDNYLWYFHTEEEGLNLPGGLFFKPPNERVTRIPLTPKMLHEFVDKGEWKIDYPPHTIPPIRYDMVINQGCFRVFFLIFIIYLLYRLFF
jgi:hypothetical protein